MASKRVRRLPNELLADLCGWLCVLELFMANKLDSLVTSSALLYAYLPDLNGLLVRELPGVIRLLKALKEQPTAITSVAGVEKPQKRESISILICSRRLRIHCYIGGVYDDDRTVINQVNVQSTRLDNPCLIWLLRFISARTGCSYKLDSSKNMRFRRLQGFCYALRKEISCVRVPTKEFLSATSRERYLPKCDHLELYSKLKSEKKQNRAWMGVVDWLAADVGGRPKRLDWDYRQYEWLVDELKKVLTRLVEDSLHLCPESQQYLDKRRFSNATRPNAFSIQFHGYPLKEFTRFNARTGEVLQLRDEVNLALFPYYNWWPFCWLLRRPVGEQDKKVWVLSEEEGSRKKKTPIQLEVRL